MSLLRVVTLQSNVWDGFQREIPYLVMWMEMLHWHLCCVDSALSGAGGVVCTA